MKYIKKEEIGARPKMALILTNQEWSSIKKPIKEAQDNEKMMEQLITQSKERKLKSKLMTANWPNTVASKQLQREKQILGKAEKANEQRIQEYYDILDTKKKEKEEIIETAKKMINERQESSRIINSALVLSNVLYERSKQMELERIKRDIRIERALEERSIRRSMAEAYSKEKYEEKVKHEESMQTYKRMLDTQMIDILHQRAINERQKTQEKEDLKNDQTELTELQEQERKESKEKKEKLKKDQELWAQIDSQYKEQRKKKSEEEEQMNSIYQAVKEKINKQRDEMEKKLKREIIDRRAKVQDVRNIQRDIEQNEEEMLQKALEEREEIIIKELEARALKKEKLRQELKSFEKEAERFAEEDAKRRLEMQRYEMLQRLAIEDGDRNWRAAQKEETIIMQKEMRVALMEQWSEQEKRKIESKWDDVTAYENEKAKEEESLLQYCEEIKKEAAESGRPLYPVLAAISRVKKSAGLGKDKKKVPFLQSRVPIASVGAYEK